MSSAVYLIIETIKTTQNLYKYSNNTLNIWVSEKPSESSILNEYTKQR